jgi:hypothetical protein
MEDAPRSGRPIKTSERQRAKITALACSEALAGHARWSPRFLAEKVKVKSDQPDLAFTMTGIRKSHVDFPMT